MRKSAGNLIDSVAALWDFPSALMFTLSAFAVMAGALLGGVWWVCRNDQDAS